MGAREGSWLAYTHTIPLDTLDLHAVDRYRRLGLLLGFEPSTADFSFPISAEAENAATALLRDSGIAPERESDTVLLAPGTIWQTKQWTPEGFASVARHFLAQGRPVALIGAASDRRVCQAVAQLAPGVADLCARTSLSELAAIMRRAGLVVANDSGPLHLAVAQGRPVVGIFGPTDALWVGPYERPAATISAGVPCSPCYLRLLRQCPNGHACMQLIAPDTVIARAEQMLGTPTTASQSAASF
jgi:ADP-heptose:LPS heptosyltransferase